MATRRAAVCIAETRSLARSWVGASRPAAPAPIARERHEPLLIPRTRTRFAACAPTETERAHARWFYDSGSGSSGSMRARAIPVRHLTLHSRDTIQPGFAVGHLRTPLEHIHICLPPIPGSAPGPV